MKRIRPAGAGNIFYDNLGDIGNSSAWTTVYNEAESYFGKVEVISAPGIRTAGFLHSMGLAELEKEKQMLTDYFGINTINWTEDNYEEIIKAMNQALNIEAVFARVVDRINSNEADKKDTVLASIYGDYLKPILDSRIESFFSDSSVINNLFNGYSGIVGSQFEEVVFKAMDDALTELLQREADPEKDDKRKIWDEALNAINQVENFRSAFGVEFFSRYGFDDLKKVLVSDIKNNLDYNKLKENVLQTYQQKISGKLGMQTTAGYVAERLGHAFQMASSPTLQWSVNYTSRSGSYSSDKISIIGEGDVDFSNMYAKNKMEAIEKIRDFHKKMADGMKGKTVIYENTKKYGLGKNFKGFHGNTRPLDSIGEILGKIGYGDANAFINKIKQTIPGAMYSGGDFKRLAEDSLAAAVGFLLFDDIDTIGNAGGDINAVHIFRLSDIILPLSFLLISLGDAMADAEGNIRDYVRVNIGLPGATMFDYPQKDRSGAASEARWVEQANAASRESTVTINFLSNFKSIIGGLF